MTAEQRVAGMFQEAGLPDRLIPTYTRALLALRDRDPPRRRI
ncbi:hypothetical protein ACPCSC_30660 [Streptomyces lavendulocolor]